MKKLKIHIGYWSEAPFVISTLWLIRPHTDDQKAFVIPEQVFLNKCQKYYFDLVNFMKITHTSGCTFPIFLFLTIRKLSNNTIDVRKCLTTGNMIARQNRRRCSTFNKNYIIVSWGSETTPLATPFFKMAYKISHLPGL